MTTKLQLVALAVAGDARAPLQDPRLAVVGDQRLETVDLGDNRLALDFRLRQYRTCLCVIVYTCTYRAMMGGEAVSYITDGYLTLIEAADYLGVNRVKFCRMVKRLGIPFTTSPYDQRVKLFKKEDLEELTKAPRLRDEQGGDEGKAAA